MAYEYGKLLDELLSIENADNFAVVVEHSDRIFGAALPETHSRAVALALVVGIGIHKGQILAHAREVLLTIGKALDEIHD